MSILDTITLNGIDYSLAGGGSGSGTSINTHGIDLDKAYSYPTYTNNILDSSGNPTTGIGNLTEYLPVVAGETLTLSNGLTTKIAYYKADKTFISLVSMSSGINDYTVPENAVYARYQNKYAAGDPKPLFVRRKSKPENKSFGDLILSPLNATPSICITGDSNTYGYGLSDPNNSWANILMTALCSLTTFKYGAQSKWCETIGASQYDPGYNFTKDSEFSIWTNASSVNLNIVNNYSSAWSWYVDGVLSDSSSATTITLDGSLHKVTVIFTSGQAVNPSFEITKTISYINKSSSGTGYINVPFDAGYDWLFIMIGTNDRSRHAFAQVRNTFYQYTGKGTYIVPFPNHKVDNAYTYPQIEVYSEMAEAFSNVGFDILDCSDVSGMVFYDDALYQSDKIHFNTEGHRRIANIIAGRLGFPLYLTTM